MARHKCVHHLTRVKKADKPNVVAHRCTVCTAKWNLIRNNFGETEWKKVA